MATEEELREKEMKDLINLLTHKNPVTPQDTILGLLKEVETLKEKKRAVNFEISTLNWRIRYIESQEIADFLEKNQGQLKTTPKNFEKFLNKIRRGL